ncbi:glycoside hydrolase family 43 protein [Sphingomonas sp.]|jgi:beta-xylosidase|uniref:glycoside hydrolase family 43 protein n=1 Tax=Sphingomonas sp. TaxID=28214 RepID=UPI002ED7C061
MIRKTLSLLFLLACLGASPALAQGGSATLRMPDMPLHDPWIVADKKTRTYYLFTRNEASMTGVRDIGTMVYTSRNLRDWTRPKLVFSLPKGIWAVGGAWAPEVHRYKGKYYLFTTLHNEALPRPKLAHGREAHARGTVVAVANRPDGPYTLLNQDRPTPDPNLMTLDGTLYVDEAKRPWIVYAHEWVQIRNGTIEAARLAPDLSIATGEPITLFRATDAPWVAPQKQPDGDSVTVTDGPEFFRTRTGKLLMLWSSWGKGGYVQSIARSRTGKLAGPWEQLPPLMHKDSGHGMLFRDFDNRLMMVLHRPFKNARGRLFEMRDTGDSVEIVRQRCDLDADKTPEADCKGL